MDLCPLVTAFLDCDRNGTQFCHMENKKYFEVRLNRFVPVRISYPDDHVERKDDEPVRVEIVPYSQRLWCRMLLLVRSILVCIAVHSCRCIFYASTHENRPLVLTAFDQYQRGQKAYAENRLEDAVRFYKSAIEHHHVLAPAYNNLAIVLARLNRKEEAIAFHEKAVVFAQQAQDWETFVGAYNNLGYIVRHGQEKSYDKALHAIKYFDKALQIQPPNCSLETYVQTLYNKASALLSIRDNVQAEVALREVLRLNPAHSGAHLDMGSIYFYR
jgi:hypothetical protein